MENSVPPSLLPSSLSPPLLLPSLLLYPLFLPSPNSASLLATYLTHMGSWGVLCPFKATQLNLLPRKFHAARPEVSSFLLHPTLSHPWQSPLLMYYVSLLWTGSKASWQGLWDAAPPPPRRRGGPRAALATSIFISPYVAQPGLQLIIFLPELPLLGLWVCVTILSSKISP